MEGRVNHPVYLSPGQVAELREVLERYGDTLQAVFDRLADDGLRKSRDSILAGRNQAAAAEAGISKAFEDAFSVLTAEAEEQEAQIRLRDLEAEQLEGGQDGG
jgi:hypothetical protein